MLFQYFCFPELQKAMKTNAFMMKPRMKSAMKPRSETIRETGPDAKPINQIPWLITRLKPDRSSPSNLCRTLARQSCSYQSLPQAAAGRNAPYFETGLETNMKPGFKPVQSLETWIRPMPGQYFCFPELQKNENQSFFNTSASQSFKKL